MIVTAAEEGGAPSCQRIWRKIANSPNVSFMRRPALSMGDMLTISMCALLLFGGFATRASATTITFDEPSSVGDWTTSFSEAGFQFQITGGYGIVYHGVTDDCNPTCADNQTPWLSSLDFGNDITIVMRRADGGLFSFQDFDGAESYSGYLDHSYPQRWAAGIQVTGLRADNSTVSKDFALDFVDDGQGGLADFQTFTVNSDFDRLVELRFTSIPLDGANGFTIDNVVVNSSTPVPAVPEPTSLLLLISGLFVVGVRRRRKPGALPK